MLVKLPMHALHLVRSSEFRVVTTLYTIVASEQALLQTDQKPAALRGAVKLRTFHLVTTIPFGRFNFRQQGKGPLTLQRTQLFSSQAQTSAMIPLMKSL